jgi:quercetin dioxygenase-like cupin family protein
MDKTDLLKDIPHDDKGFLKTKIVDTPDLLLMRIALLPSFSVPQHKANSNVHICLLRGKLKIRLNGKEEFFSEGELVPVEYGTEMLISNACDSESVFMVIKTPHPSEFAK